MESGERRDDDLAVVGRGETVHHSFHMIVISYRMMHPG